MADIETSEEKVQTVTVKDKEGNEHKRRAILLEPDEFVRHQAGGFANFLKDYAVVGLALGFIIGQQANGVVKQFVTSFIDPISNVWFGASLSNQSATLHHHQDVVKVPWGAFVYVLLEFFLVVFALYAIVKIFRLDKFTGKKIKKKKKKS